LWAAKKQNLVNIDSSDLELIYEHAIENRPKDSRVSQCLGQFHGFLETFYGLAPIESLELKSKRAELSNENANLITLGVYQTVLKGLGWKQPDLTRWQRLQILVWIICYRCGFRPSEVLNLRLSDVQFIGNQGFEILVRQAKTDRGNRRAPASLYLSQDEIDFFLGYYHQRSKEIGLFGDNHLFSHHEQKSGTLAEGVLLDPIRELLRFVTKDETLRLYHARHSFNSCLQAQFLLKGEPVAGHEFLDLDVSTQKDAQLRAALMGREQRGRKDQHVQAILVGHASPEMTNQYYNHLSDVLLGHLVRQKRDKTQVSLKTMMMLSGLSQSRADELLKNSSGHPLTSLVTLQAQKHESQLQHPLLGTAERIRLPKEKATQAHNTLPLWEDALSTETARTLKRGEKNWRMAHLVYEGVRTLDGRRLKTAIVIVEKIKRQMDLPSKRWRGPTYSSMTALRSVLELLEEIGIETKDIILVHHPRRGQTDHEEAIAVKKWQQRINTPVRDWHSGETGNASTTPTKGAVEIKVVNPTGKTNKNKQPAMSKGFEVAIRMLCDSVSAPPFDKK